MRTAITIDNEPFSKAADLAEPGTEKSELMKECVKAFVQRQNLYGKGCGLVDLSLLATELGRAMPEINLTRKVSA